MADKMLKTSAITSALVYAFCWQLPMVLAGLGLSLRVLYATTALSLGLVTYTLPYR